MKEIIEYLEKAEGKTVHRNQSETDITSPLGIYKTAHPTAMIFRYLETVALECGIAERSSNWNKSDMDAINRKMDYARVKELTTEFYKEFLKGVYIEEFPSECKLAVFSMYVNSPKNCVIAVQEAINDMIKSEHITNELLVPDGSFGEKTKIALRKIAQLSNNVYGFLFEAKLVFEMSRIYAKLVVNNPKSNLQYLIGWNNRIDKLLEER